MKNFIKSFFTIKDRKTLSYTSIGFAFFGFVCIAVHHYKRKSDAQYYKEKSKADAENAIRKKRAETECDIMKMASQTAFSMMKRNNSVNSDGEGNKAEAFETKDEIKSEGEDMNQNSNSSDTRCSSTQVSDTDYRGCSSEELFNRSYKCHTNWIVDGYMKTDMINLLVAGAGVGKSICLTQIAIAVAKGIRPEFLPSCKEASVKMHVLFYRLEDFSGELEGKYGNGEVFHGSDLEWFLPRHLPVNSLDGFLEHLKGVMEVAKKDVLVCIDPVTKLSGYKHENFIKGMEKVMAMAKSHGITMTVAASIHLDEIKDWTELTNSNIKGGDKALQQAGSVTAIRRERREGHCYLQCMKEPKGYPKPFDGNVLVCKFEEGTPDVDRYLHYSFDCIKPEAEARPLKNKIQIEGEPISIPSGPNQKVTPEMKDGICDMLSNGEKIKTISEKYNISEKTVYRYKKQLKDAM